MINITYTNDKLPKTGGSAPASSPQASVSGEISASKGEASLELKLLSVKIQSSLLLSLADKSLLQKLNPALSQTLTKQLLSPSPTQTSQGQAQAQAATTAPVAPKLVEATLAKAPLHLIKFNHGQQQHTLITPEVLKAGQTIALSRQNQQWVLAQSPQGEKLNHQIKAILPKQQPIQQLQQLAENLQKLPKPIQQKLLAPQLQEPLKQLNLFTHETSSLDTRQKVQTAIQNSGIFFESKLISHKPAHQDIRQALNSLTKAIAQGNNNLAGKDKNTNTTKEIETLIRSLPTGFPLATQSRSTQNQSSHSLFPATESVLQLLGIKLSSQLQANTQPQELISQQLKRSAEEVLAKIQVLQLKSLGVIQSDEDKGVSTRQQWHTEIPLKFNDQLYGLQIQIQEQEWDNDSEEQENTSEEVEETTRCWHVFLSFDLPDNEKLHTQIKLVDTEVSATLWAESEKLCQKTQENLKELHQLLSDKGLTVKEIHCHQGKPPQSKMNFGYNLIDITT